MTNDLGYYLIWCSRVSVDPPDARFPNFKAQVMGFVHFITAWIISFSWIQFNFTMSDFASQIQSHLKGIDAVSTLLIRGLLPGSVSVSCSLRGSSSFFLIPSCGTTLTTLTRRLKRSLLTPILTEVRW